MNKTVTVIPGDGIGPEVTGAVLRVLDAVGARLEYDHQVAGTSAVPSHGSVLPQETVDSINAHRVALKGPLTTPSGSGFRSVNVAIRKEFALYANVRPVRTILPGGRYEDIDLVLIRENTEGLYVGVEHFIGMENDPKAAAESVMITTRYGSERIVRFAFDYAAANGREKVTLAHKANILKHTQGLFLDVGRRIAEGYADRVGFEDRIIDATAMYLVLDPYRFDVLVMENMFGDILSDLMAGLVGGLGFAPAANIGEDHAVFEAVHGSAPDIAGQGVANPTGLLLSACLLLEHVGQPEEAARVRSALYSVIRDGVSRTRDMGGSAGTAEFTDAVIGALA
ncbi:MAG: isocitrate/isopropylmalate family dehydrogenase [Gemmatimonadetes bacterium]|nr:isocitrate/isopropylmalate family dehydrogenase [Gemmatimonadota bacterium]